MLRVADFSIKDKSAFIRRLQSTLKGHRPSITNVGTLSYQRLATVDPSRACRQQHQLATVEEDHREAMKVFLVSLNTAMTSSFPRNSFSAPCNTAAPVEEQGVLSSDEAANSNGLFADETEFPQSISVQETHTIPQTMQREDQAMKKTNDLNVALGRAIRKHRTQKCLELFQKAIKDKHLVDPKLVVSLFYLVSKRNPVASYEILQYYNLHPETADIRIDMYRRLCIAVSNLDPRGLPQRKMVQFIETLLAELDAMDEEIKEVLYPILTASLVAQRSVCIGPFAASLYKYMVANDFEIAPGWLKKLLSSSKYNRQEDLPFHDILSRLVAMGEMPHPLSALPVIHNMFPYTDTAQMCVMLGALLDIHKKIQVGEDDKVAALYKKFSLDRSTLETISTGAAHSGDPQLILLVWDVLDVYGYKPTAQIYENTVVAFACRRDGLYEAFAALATMKDDGFDVSSALIRSFSRAIRHKRSHVDDAFRLLTAKDSGEIRCLENFNVVLSSYAERGDVNETGRVFKAMRDFDCQPNQDSYAYSMEALGKDLHRRKSSTDRSWVQKNTEIAGSLLATMDEEGVSPSADFVRNYVELLCLASELETATSLIENCLSTDEMKSIVNNKSLYRVALANAETGNIEIAKKLASATSEEIPILHRKIRSKEQRFNHLESIRRMREKEAQNGSSGEDSYR
eukprot:scaffold1697_cov120-Cylindrotheca_fusiformis.AAC.32